MAWPKGRRKTEEERAKHHKPHTEKQREANRQRMLGRKITWGDKISVAKKGIVTSIQKGDVRSPNVCAKIKAGFTDEGREKISEANRGKVLSEKHKHTISTLMKKEGRQHFTGGKIADMFAEVLCPIGFIREYKFYYARGIHSYFQFDFAHLEGKICIELDGQTHRHTQMYDNQRDEIVKHFGWRVIRIRNY